MPKGRPTDPTVKRKFIAERVAKRLYLSARDLSAVGALCAALKVQKLAQDLPTIVLED